MTEEDPGSPRAAGEAEPGAGGGMDSMTPREVRDATLMLRRPTVVDHIQESVPIPAGAVPRDGLPFWNRVPLGSKLPVIDHPKDAFVFYRDKLGRGLWRSSLVPVHEFRLDDPYMREVDYSYEAVHDPHLQRMFQSEEHRRTLLQGGFILPTDEAVCSLRQFNTYRRYLQTVYRELVKEEYRKQALDLSDEQAIRRARHCEERQLVLDEKRIEREKKQGELRQHLEEERRKKQQQLVARQLRYLELLQRVEERKEEQRQLAVERAREMDEKVQHRQAVAAEIQRARVIATIQAWNREERERKERLEKQQLQLQEYKEREVQRQWQAKVECQRSREERERRLLARREEALRLAVELRNKKCEREDLRMRALLKHVKEDREKLRAKRLRMRPAKRKRPGRSAAARNREGSLGEAGNAKRRRRVASTGFIVDEGNMTRLDRMFNVSMRIVKTGHEHGAPCLVGDTLWSAFTDTGFDPSEERDGVPEAVATAVDGLLDSVMEGIVHRMVMQTLKCVYHKALERCFALMEDLPAREMAKRGWVCHHGMIRHSELRQRAKAREQRECRRKEASGSNVDSSAAEGGEEEDADARLTQSEEGQLGGSRSPRPPRSPRKVRSSGRGRSPERRNTEEERQKILRQIEAIERKNQQLKKTLEQTASSTTSVATAEEEREAALDLDANFEVMAKSLQKRMVAIAAQSVSEETKLTTQHRWKVMKEVELFELVDRLCTMMMSTTPKRFLKSTEFQWAADILARDVMREVRHQVRETNRKKERERARKAKEAEAASHRAAAASFQVAGPAAGRGRREREAPTGHGSQQAQQPWPRSSQGEGSGVRPGSGRGSFRPVDGVVSPPTASLEPLDESKVPLLRLHKRSPHQPSLPSLNSLA